MRKILVVDDSSMSRKALRKILTSAGYEIIEAGDGMNALEQYYLNKPDLVLLDMVMNGMGGLEVLSRLCEMDRQARVIIATADIQSSTREMTIAAGARGFISKPFIADEILNVIDAVLSGGHNDLERKAD